MFPYGGTRRVKLNAARVGRSWFTTEVWVREFLEKLEVKQWEPDRSRIGAG